MRFQLGTHRDLDRFTGLMARHGWHMCAARMAFDPLYARERIALAHTSADAELRRLAVELFNHFPLARCLDDGQSAESWSTRCQPLFPP
jgi:hypothetical protein